MTTKQISETIEDIYGFEASESFISDVTDKILPQIEDWQNRPLEAVYPIVFIDAIHFSVREDGVVQKRAAYVVLGVDADGRKDVLTIDVGENESSKYRLSVLNSLKNRGVQNRLILCSDGLTGIKDAISAAFPKTEHRRCIVHMVRNTLKYVANKDMKSFAKDLKTIYTAPDEKAALTQLDQVTDKWSPQYPYAMKRRSDNRDAISPIFQVFRGGQNSLLHGQCHRITEFDAEAAEPPEKCILQFSGTAESTVSCNVRSHTQVDNATTQLGKSPWRVIDHVSGASA